METEGVHTVESGLFSCFRACNHAMIGGCRKVGAKRPGRQDDAQMFDFAQMSLYIHIWLAAQMQFDYRRARYTHTWSNAIDSPQNPCKTNTRRKKMLPWRKGYHCASSQIHTGRPEKIKIEIISFHVAHVCEDASSRVDALLASDVGVLGTSSLAAAGLVPVQLARQAWRARRLA